MTGFGEFSQFHAIFRPFLAPLIAILTPKNATFVKHVNRANIDSDALYNIFKFSYPLTDRSRDIMNRNVFLTPILDFFERSCRSYFDFDDVINYGVL